MFHGICPKKQNKTCKKRRIRKKKKKLMLPGLYIFSESTAVSHAVAPVKSGKACLLRSHECSCCWTSHASCFRPTSCRDHNALSGRKCMPKLTAVVGSTRRNTEASNLRGVARNALSDIPTIKPKTPLSAPRLAFQEPWGLELVFSLEDIFLNDHHRNGP